MGTCLVNSQKPNGEWKKKSVDNSKNLFRVWPDEIQRQNKMTKIRVIYMMQRRKKLDKQANKRTEKNAKVFFSEQNFWSIFLSFSFTCGTSEISVTSTAIWMDVCTQFVHSSVFMTATNVDFFIFIVQTSTKIHTNTQTPNTHTHSHLQMWIQKKTELFVIV